MDFFDVLQNRVISHELTIEFDRFDARAVTITHSLRILSYRFRYCFGNLVQGDHRSLVLCFVDFHLAVPLSARFCLGR